MWKWVVCGVGCLFLGGGACLADESCSGRVTGVGERLVFHFLKSAHPLLVAHGRGQNPAMESTWANLAHSVEAGAGVLEADAQLTKDGRLVILHDPTLHRLVHGYATDASRVESFRARHPGRWEAMRDDWRCGLVDRIDTYTLAHLRACFRLRDYKRNVDVPILAVDELFGALAAPGEFRVPAHEEAPAGGAPAVQPERRLAVPRGVALYLDMKDLNAAARRLYGLDLTADWVRESLPTEELLAIAHRALVALSAALSAAGAHDRVFIAVRHPEIARMARAIDPRIALMASPENVTAATETPILRHELLAFAASRPELVELKFAPHALSPEIRGLAAEQGWKVLFDELPQTNPFFPLEDDSALRGLIAGLLRQGRGVLIQTNTVAELRRRLEEAIP